MKTRNQIAKNKIYYFEYLDHIEKEIVTILIHNKMFFETSEIIKSNPKINTINSFFTWMISAYVSDIVTRIRRLVDLDKRAKSLIRFLMDVKKDSVIRSRIHYLTLWNTNLIMNQLGNESFDQLSGKGASEYSQKLVQRDMDEVKAACKAIVIYANSFVAHSAINPIKKQGNKIFATFDDIRNAEKTIEKVIIKYFLLIKGSGRGQTLMPTWQYDWKKIFKTAWLPK